MLGTQHPNRVMFCLSTEQLRVEDNICCGTSQVQIRVQHVLCNFRHLSFLICNLETTVTTSWHVGIIRGVQEQQTCFDGLAPLRASWKELPELNHPLPDFGNTIYKWSRRLFRYDYNDSAAGHSHSQTEEV